MWCDVMCCVVMCCDVIQVMLCLCCNDTSLAWLPDTGGVVHCSLSSSKTELWLDSAVSISTVLQLHQHYHLTSHQTRCSQSALPHWLCLNPILSVYLLVGLPILLLRLRDSDTGHPWRVRGCEAVPRQQLGSAVHTITHYIPSSSLPASLNNYTLHSIHTLLHTYPHYILHIT